MKKANDLVSLLKSQRKDVLDWLNETDIDFMGCSENYVEEKIVYLISALQDLKKHLRLVDKRQDETSNDTL